MKVERTPAATDRASDQHRRTLLHGTLHDADQNDEPVSEAFRQMRVLRKIKGRLIDLSV